MELDTVLLIGALVVLVAVLAARIGARLGLPSLLIFLGLGMALGSVFEFKDAGLAHALGFAALVLILGEGGLTTKWADIRGTLGLATLLAVVGVGVSIGLVALFCHLLLGLNLGVSVLLGAVTAPTDSAAVFSVLRKVPIPARLRAILEAESGLNDAPVVLLVAVATELAMGAQFEGGPLMIGLLVVGELLGGVLIGVLVGLAGVWVMRTVALPSSGLYPLAAMGWAVLSYGLGTLVHVSGFAAVYFCAVLLGNKRLPHRAATRSFAEGVGWIAQIGLFVMLGLLAEPSRLTWNSVVIGVLLGLFCTFVARPVSVFVCTVWFKINWREHLFLSWAGLRGAVPIIMATVPMAAGLTRSDQLFDVVLVFVIVFTLVQAPTLAWLARVLQIAADDTTDAEVEVAPLDRIGADLIQVKVPVGSKLQGVEIRELRLPRACAVSLVVRGGEPFVPAPGDKIRIGDEMIVVAPSQQRARVEERFHQVGRGGRLARWREIRQDHSDL